MMPSFSREAGNCALNMTDGLIFSVKGSFMRLLTRLFSKIIHEDDYLLPIPQKDLRLNKNLTQNPGYTNPNGK